MSMCVCVRVCPIGVMHLDDTERLNKARAPCVRAHFLCACVVRIFNWYLAR